MIVEAVMTKSVVTVSPDDSLEVVRDIFHRHQFHHLVVIEAGKVTGVISDRDLLRNLSPFIGTKAERREDEFLLHRRVHQIMERRVVSVKPSTPIKEAVAVLLHHRVSCLPVLEEDGRLAGIATWHDLLRYMLDCTVVANAACSINGWQPPREPGRGPVELPPGDSTEWIAPG
jgi:acetoin utilization protein AcuB